VQISGLQYVQLFSQFLGKTLRAAGVVLAGEVIVVVVAPANLDAVADVVSQAQRPGRGSSLNLAR
jgi:hypothetical protein